MYKGHRALESTSLAWIEEFGNEIGIACGCVECTGSPTSELGSSPAAVVVATSALGR